MKKCEKEWTISFPWGDVAMVGWGNALNPPILMVHGYMDTAATFIPLVNLLPDKYYFVAFDMPGLGKSDPFPPGLQVSQLYIVEIIRGIVEYMKWSSFTYISHSMGFIIGMFYNHLYPGKIKRMVHMDPGPPLSFYYFPHYKPQYWYMSCDYYYSNYSRWSKNSPKEFTYEEAVSRLAQNRGLTEKQAEIVLSRSLIPTAHGKYRFSWEDRMKKILTIPVSEDILRTIIIEGAPPMLILEASDYRSIPGSDFSKDIINMCSLVVPNCVRVTINAGHDLHITNPESIVPYIVSFFNDTDELLMSSLSPTDGHRPLPTLDKLVRSKL